jgi:hypothetical protein
MGPSPVVYLDQKCFLNKHVLGQAGFKRNAADPRFGHLADLIKRRRMWERTTASAPMAELPT